MPFLTIKFLGATGIFLEGSAWPLPWTSMTYQWGTKDFLFIIAVWLVLVSITWGSSPNIFNKNETLGLIYGKANHFHKENALCKGIFHLSLLTSVIQTLVSKKNK